VSTNFFFWNFIDYYFFVYLFPFFLIVKRRFRRARRRQFYQGKFMASFFGDELEGQEKWKERKREAQLKMSEVI
jgi:hypothetical protein